MLLGSPLPGLVMLVVIKTAADWRAHWAERRKFAPLEPETGARMEHAGARRLTVRG